MKALNRLLLFAFLLSSSLIGLHVLLIIGLKKSNLSNWGVWNEIISGTINANLVFTGSSRAFHHFDPEIIDKITNQKSYNIGSDGSFFELQIPRLTTYLMHNKKPNLIIQGIDLEALETRKFIWKGEQYIPYLFIDDVYKATKEIDKDYWMHKYFPLYTFGYYGLTPVIAAVNGFVPILKENHIRNGYYPVDKQWTNDFEKFKEQFPNGYNYPIEQSAIDNLRRILTIAKNEKVKIILVYTPEYIENYSLSKNRVEIFNTYRKIAAEFNVPLWDYSGTEICKQKKYFYNSQHLNKEGAELFSKQIATDLNQYLKNIQ